jgi:hypothetical protein
MGVVPNRIVDKIAFFESRVDRWTTNAVAMGTTAAAVTAMAAKAVAARDALAAQEVAANAAKTATETLRLAVEALNSAGAGIIEQVRTQARTAGPGVYALADLPLPAVPSSRPAPGQPTEFKAALLANGMLQLKWKCPNPPGAAGTIYQIWRKFTLDEAEVYIGGSGRREYIDNTVPRGTSSIIYQIQAVRSTVAGPWSQFIVSLGSTGGVTVTETTPVRRAA